MENAISRIGNGDINKEWTYYYPKENKVEQIDYLLLSPALSKKNKNAIPSIERRGIANYRRLKEEYDFQLKRFEGVKAKGTEASDHCPVFMELEI